MYQGTTIPLGFVQNTYTDQMGAAFPGDLYSESDYNQIDHLSIDETAGIMVGLGVKRTFDTTATRQGANSDNAKLPTSAAADGDFYGILVRTHAGFSDANGDAYWPNDRSAPVARRGGAVTRVWVRAYGAVTAGNPCYWRKAELVTTNAAPLGALVDGAITGGGNTDTVVLTKAIFVTSAADGGVALVELS